MLALRDEGNEALRGQGSERKLYSSSRGKGSPIVFIHGALVTHSDWPEAILAPAARLGEAITVDRPGHGRSPRPRFNGDPLAQARLMRAGLGLDQPAILVGHSFGALTALAYADIFPSEVSALVLIAPVCFPEWRVEQLFLGPRALPAAGPVLSLIGNASIDSGLLHLAQRMMFAPQQVPEAWLANFPFNEVLSHEAFVSEAEDALAASPLGRGAYRSRMPTQPLSILQGDADGVVYNGWHAQMMHRLLPRSRLIWLNGVGHMAHHVAPKSVLEEIARYR